MRHSRTAARPLPPLPPIPDAFPWTPFPDAFWQAESEHREALDAVRTRRYWRVDMDDTTLILFGTNADVIARALVLYPTPKQILVRPCRGSDRVQSHSELQLGEFSYE